MAACSALAALALYKSQAQESALGHGKHIGFVTLLPDCAQPEEYEKLGSYAMIGLPTELYEQR